MTIPSSFPSFIMESDAAEDRAGKIVQLGICVGAFPDFLNSLSSEDRASIEAGEVPLSEVESSFQAWRTRALKFDENSVNLAKDEAKAGLGTFVLDAQGPDPVPSFVVVRSNGQAAGFQSAKAAKEWGEEGKRSYYIGTISQSRFGAVR